MNKSMKATQAKTPAPLTEEQKQEHIARVLGQKRESYIQGILFNMVRGKGDITSAEGVAMVDRAVEMADHLLETLFTIKED